MDNTTQTSARIIMPRHLIKLLYVTLWMTLIIGTMMPTMAEEVQQGKIENRRRNNQRAAAKELDNRGNKLKG